MKMELKSSLRYSMSLMFLHMAVAVSVCSTTIPVAAKIMILMPIALSLAYYLARDVLQQLPNSWVGITLDHDEVSITTRDGRSFYAQPEKNTFVFPWFIVLRIVPEEHRMAVSRVVFSDALSDDEFRELSVRLRFS